MSELLAIRRRQQAEQPGRQALVWCHLGLVDTASQAAEHAVSPLLALASGSDDGPDLRRAPTQACHLQVFAHQLSRKLHREADDHEANSGICVPPRSSNTSACIVERRPSKPGCGSVSLSATRTFSGPSTAESIKVGNGSHSERPLGASPTLSAARPFAPNCRMYRMYAPRPSECTNHSSPHLSTAVPAQTYRWRGNCSYMVPAKTVIKPLATTCFATAGPIEASAQPM